MCSDCNFRGFIFLVYGKERLKIVWQWDFLHRRNSISAFNLSLLVSRIIILCCRFVFTFWYHLLSSCGFFFFFLFLLQFWVKSKFSPFCLSFYVCLFLYLRTGALLGESLNTLHVFFGVDESLFLAFGDIWLHLENKSCRGFFVGFRIV